MHKMASYVRVVNGIEKSQNFRKRTLVISLSSILLVVVVVSVVIGTTVSSKTANVEHHGWKTVSKFVKSACSQTRYPDMCVSSMVSYPGYQTATPEDMTNIAVQASMDWARKAHSFAVSLTNNSMSKKERAAWQDCLELFEDTMDRLNVCVSNSVKKKAEDVQTWLSAALTNQDTCLNGFRDLNATSNNVKALMSPRAMNVSQLLSNSLAMFKFSNLRPTIVHNRRLLSTQDYDFYSHYGRIEQDGFPEWLSAGDRRLLQASTPASQANVVVAKDGSGRFTTITAAINAAPQESSNRYVIYVKAGIYNENVDISKKMTNLMLIGDGMDRTVVTANSNVQEGATTFKSATVAVSGNGFIARDMTFENTAGPQKQQAVALRVGADLSVLYRCSFKGYQDTLYVYSLRQFYREVDIYGTVDFIFGNAAVVIQNSNIYARRPGSNQKNTITAQGRTDPNQNTGISIQNCRVTAASDLQPVRTSIQTYLGRPWKQYSRTVFMQSTLDDLINPAGWLEWDGNFALGTLYYGEYMNSGAGAGTAGRVKWPGYHVMTSPTQASQFTVNQFISGNSWIPATGVAFTSGLN
eukprot:Gb_24214 [translate_table: standard]